MYRAKIPIALVLAVITICIQSYLVSAESGSVQIYHLFPNGSTTLVSGDGQGQPPYSSVASTAPQAVQTQPQIQEARSAPVPTQMNPNVMMALPYINKITSASENWPEYHYQTEQSTAPQAQYDIQSRSDPELTQNSEMPSGFSRLYQYYQNLHKPQTQQAQEPIWDRSSSSPSFFTYKPNQNGQQVQHPEERVTSNDVENFDITFGSKPSTSTYSYDSVHSPSEVTHHYYSDSGPTTSHTEYREFPGYTQSTQSSHVYGKYSDDPFAFKPRPRPAHHFMHYFNNFKNNVPKFSFSPYQGKEPLSIFSTVGKTLDSTFSGAWAARRALKTGTGAVLASKVRLGGTVVYVGADVLAKAIEVAAAI